MSNFGSRLKELRKLKNMTQDDLAKLFFINKSSVSRYENNTQFPELELLNKIAAYFNVSIDYLLGRTDNFETENTNDTYDFLNKNLKININGNCEEVNQDELDKFIYYLDDLGINVEKILEKIKTNKTNKR